MARYLAIACPRCNGYVGIVIRDLARNVPVEAVNGRCTRCPDRMAWILIAGQACRAAFLAIQNRSTAESSAYIMLIAIVVE